MKIINDLYNFFKKKDIDNTREVTYYSTDKNSFVTIRVPKNVKIVTKKNNSNTYIDYDVNTYYKNKHLSNDSYFLHFPKTILDYKKKLQENGLILENDVNRNNIINENNINEIEIDYNIDSNNILMLDNIIQDYFKEDNIISNECTNSSEYTNSIEDVNSIIDDYLYQEDETTYKIEPETYLKIEKSKHSERNTFYNSLKQDDAWSIYSNIN